ncbi:MAG: LytTR family DNA-binding domain-containing protein [Muribaculaceae bacterium]|nr:LytTR family DNA-binding domain-containing protein [Muribaculaceae bacterium]
MDNMRCCVIDDEPLAGRLIAGYIEKTPSLTLVGAYRSADEAIRPIVSGEVDLLFLDIQMPQLNGLEFAKIVPDSCRIIFTTAYDTYAIQGFKVNALDYLLKPVSYDDFLESIARARKALHPGNGSGSDRIIVKSEYKMVQIDTADILYIEGEKDYVKIVTKSHPDGIMTLMNMKAIEQALPSEIFMRVHRSYIVNTSHISTIERNRIIFGDTAIPVSDSYKNDFAAYVSAHSV